MLPDYLRTFWDIELKDIAGDNIVYFFKKCLELLVENFIPMGWFKENGFDQSNLVCLSEVTVSTRFAQAFASLKAEFPEHPQLSGEESKQI